MNINLFWLRKLLLGKKKPAASKFQTSLCNLKRVCLVHIFAIAAMAEAGTVTYTTTIDGIPWTWTVENGRASLGGSASLQPPKTAIPQSTEGAIVIPSNLGPYHITGINDYAFLRCANLSSVTIPTGVENIGNYAFEYCSGLVSATIPSSVTNIGYFAFYNCTNLTSLAISNGVTRIGCFAFCNCSSLTSVTIPDGVTNIEYEAFKGCANIKSVTIPASITSIGRGAFGGCTNLESVHIADLGAWCRISFEDGDANPLAFAHHLYVDGIEVRNLVIPDGVMSIGQYAFTGCTNLVSVTLPPSLTSMGAGAFGGCRGLESVHISDLYAWCGINFANGNANPLSLAHHLFLNGGEVQNLFFPSGLTKVEEYAFVGCGSLLSIMLPSSVTSIGGNAFYGCNGLTSVAIPSGVTSIGNGAFLGCDNLSSLTISGKNWWPADFISSHSITNLVIAEGSTSVEEAAFAGWDGLISVTIPSGVTSIGIEAFSFCKALTTVEMPDGVTSIGEAAFADCENLVSVNIPDSVVNIEGFAFYRCGSLKSMKIPYGVTSIGFRTFLSCTELASVTIPNSVTNIGVDAFAGCSSLASVTIPNSVTTIDEGAFCECTSLTTVTIPNGVTTIGAATFGGCSGLTSVTIPPSVTTIGGEAFVGCVNLTSVIIPYSVTTLESQVFYECSNLKRVYLPDHFREVALDLGLGRKFRPRYYRLFEGVDIENNLIWVDAEGAAWLEQEESGQSIARSGIISSCATSSVETVLIGPGTLSFDWRVSSNGDGCCRLYIDDVECRAIMSSSTWMTETVTVSNGEHIARWSFTSSSANASDAAFLTRVSWVPAVVVGDLEIPLDWLTECAATIIAAHGGDKAAAAHATAANGMNKVWECYVAGLSPTNAGSVFRTVISFDNGEPVVSWEPKLSPEEETKRTYVIEGKANLTDTWSPTNSASRFFRVRVGMP